MSGEYSNRRYRTMRKQFRLDCQRGHAPCSWCRQPIDYTLTTGPGRFEVDHYLATSTHNHLFWSRENWRPIHKRCNQSKGNKGPTAVEWVAPRW